MRSPDVAWLAISKARGNHEASGPITTGRRPELDGLRGIAVLAVMAFHFNLPGSALGFLGVDVFFVLSGYLITSILAREWQRSGSVDWRRFYVRRAARLLPAFWLLLGVLALSVPGVQIAASFGYLENLSMAFDWLRVEAELGHTWSLATEWQFYLLWPIGLLFALNRWSPRRVALGALTLGLASAGWRAVVWTIEQDWLRVFTAPDTHADGLLIGSALGLATTFGLMPRIHRAWVAAVLVMAVGLVLLPPLPFGVTASYVGILITVLATALLVARPLPILSFAPLRWVGTISYGLYLWHVPIVNQDAIYAAGPVVVTLMTFAVAGLSYRYVEAPILRLAHSRRPRGALAAGRRS